MQSEIQFCPLDDRFKSPAGSCKQGQKNLFHLKILRSLYAYSVTLVIHREGEKPQRIPMLWEDLVRGENLYVCSFTPPQTGLYFYHFEIDVFARLLKIGRDAALNAHIGGEFQLTVTDKNFKTPDWFKGGTMYHIFVDRFFKGSFNPSPKKNTVMREWGELPDYGQGGKVLNNDFFGGNLYGVSEKLSYLKTLGVTVIYLSPIFDAFSNHKYDTGDYLTVDSMFGGDRALKNLTDKAKELGISVILDGVFNHAGDDSVYFNKYGSYDSIGAYQSKDSPYYPWFNFTKHPDSYECWWDILILPSVNETEKSYQEFIIGEWGVVDKWQSYGIKGFRLDVVDELPDSFLNALNKKLKTNDKDALLIGEVWEDASNKISYGIRRQYFLGKQLDSVMNYPLKEGILEYVKSGNVKKLRTVIYEQMNNYPKCVLDSLMNILGTHDTVRVLTALGLTEVPLLKSERAVFRLTEKEREKAVKLLKLASLLQFTLYGVPCIYYGDEAGVEGLEDPFCRSCYPWGKEDKELISWYKTLKKLRKNKVFKKGNYRELYAENKVFIFERFTKSRSVFIGINRSSYDFCYRFDKEATEFFTGEAVQSMTIPAKYGFSVLIGKNR